MARIRIEVYGYVLERELGDKRAYALFRELLPKEKEVKQSNVSKPKEEQMELAMIKCGRCGLTFATVQDYRAHLKECKQG